MRLEPSVELDGVNVSAAVGEELRQRTEARADLEGDVRRAELGEAGDDAEDVVVGEEVLPEGLLRRRPAHGAGRPKAALALLSISCSSVATSSPAQRARTARVWSTLAGSFRLPRSGCGAR